MTRIVHLTTLVTLLALGTSASADVISNFTFTGPPWTAQKEADFPTFAANAPSVDTDANSVTSILSNSGHTGGGYMSFYIRDIDGGTVGVADANDFLIFSATDTPGVGMNVGLSNATVPTNYFSFTVTPDAGFQTTFDSVSLYTKVTGTSDQYNVEIRAWDGSSETSLGLVNRTSPASPSNSPVVQDVIDFTNFTSASATEFRFYGYNATGGANAGVRYDDIIINGTTVVVPEPFSATLLGGGLVFALISRRRK